MTKKDASFEILLSCMNQRDMSLVEKSNIRCQVLAVNQINDEKNSIEDGTVWQQGRATMHHVRETGLSRSRNYALTHAEADICLLADNDEIFEDDVEEKILEAFEKYPQADLMIFKIANHPKKIKETYHKIARLECLRVASVQIALRRSRVLSSGVHFNVHLGAGTGNGAAEENKFLMDCQKAGLEIWNAPVIIGNLRNDEGGSSWFHGYDARFFYNRGMTTRFMLGLPLSLLYAIYFVLRKRKMYIRDISMRGAFINTLRGIRENRLAKESQA